MTTSKVCSLVCLILILNDVFVILAVDHDGDEPLNVAADAPSPQSISNLMSPPPSTSRNFDPLSPGDMNASQRSGQGSRDVSFNVPHGLGPNVFGGTQKTRGSSHSGSPNRSNLFRTPQQNRSKRKNGKPCFRLNLRPKIVFFAV